MYAPAKTQSDPVAALLYKNLEQAGEVIPSHLNPEKMARLALRTIRTNPNLQRCTPASLVSCVMEAGAMGLEIDIRGHAYLVPYGNEATLIVGYKGLMELAYRSGKVKMIYAEIICENDQFEYELGLYRKLSHVPSLGDRGRIKGVYAVAKMEDGETQFVVMSTSDIDQVRNASRTKGGGPWQQWYAEMAKKTAIRRLCKYLPLSTEMEMAVAIDEARERGECYYIVDSESYANVPSDAQAVSKLEAAISNAAQPKPEAQPASATEKKAQARKKPQPKPEPEPVPEPEPLPEPAPEPQRQMPKVEADYLSLCADFDIPTKIAMQVVDMLSRAKGITSAHAMTIFLNDNQRLVDCAKAMIDAEKAEKA